MTDRSTSPHSPNRISGSIRNRIERGGERLWRYEDFGDLPFTAVAQSLSRLTRQGTIERLSKGVYWRSRNTTFGKSRPNPSDLRKLAGKRSNIFPAGIAAANLLGFSTQTARLPEVATTGLSLPRKLIGNDTIVYTKRPAAWARLEETDAALLDFLRHGGRTSELSPDDTARRTVVLLSETDRFDRLAKVAGTEPPRVRAMLGAIGEEIDPTAPSLERLRASLNPLSRFDFGLLAGLRFAHQWQAKAY